MCGLIKRFFDIISSFVMLCFTFPIFIVIAFLIKLDDGGKIFFLQDRMGLKGKKFKIIKFRTMVENAEEIGTGLDSYANDFRVTKIGKVLRNTSLDEIPQLINILKGDMSIVGPRPPVFKTFATYPNIEKKYLVRFEVRPGVTGLAQINGRNELEWDEKIIYDTEYVRTYGTIKGLFLDLKIILLTVVKVLKNEGAYDKRK